MKIYCCMQGKIIFNFNSNNAKIILNFQNHYAFELLPNLNLCFKAFNIKYN